MKKLIALLLAAALLLVVLPAAAHRSRRRVNPHRQNPLPQQLKSRQRLPLRILQKRPLKKLTFLPLLRKTSTGPS